MKKHRAMAARYGDVVRTIQNPDFITQSRKFPDFNVYYRRADDSDRGPRPIAPLVAAIVRLDYAASSGVLITAYPEIERPEEERIVWTR